MASGEKKISFGFSKSLKKPLLNNTPAEKKVDFIECLDEKAIKVVGGEDKKDEPLVIPMLGSKTWHERILNKVNADIFEPKPEPTVNGDSNNVEIKREMPDNASGVNVVTSKDAPQPISIENIKQEVSDEPLKTLEEQAAQEILRDLNLHKQEGEETNVSVVPLPEDESLVGKKESTLEDYEQVPIEKYGEAMLRGMGWQPGKGIGKNEKIVAAVTPELRPRGMGLGADKAQIQKQIAASKSAEAENLKLVKGAYVKIIIGKQSGNYGQIEGLDDDAGRLIIKLAIGGNVISVNESMVHPVSTNEYDKNAKVLNSKKYEEYKNKPEKKKSSAREEILVEDSSEEENSKQEKEDKTGKSRDRKKSKKHKHYSSDGDFDSDRKSRKRRNSSDSDSDYKQKKSKKTKKNKRRDNSSERFAHKSKRKHKEKDKGRKKDSPKKDRDRHKRSRSRSPRRR